MDISEATFYSWKKRYERLVVSEFHRLHQLEEENAKLMQLVADLPIDTQLFTIALKSLL